MSGIRFPSNQPSPMTLQTAMANFEEEKTFFGTLFVIVTPYTRRQLKHLRSRSERERQASTLGRVIRRLQTSDSMLRKNSQEQTVEP